MKIKPIIKCWVRVADVFWDKASAWLTALIVLSAVAYGIYRLYLKIKVTPWQISVSHLVGFLILCLLLGGITWLFEWAKKPDKEDEVK